MRPSYRRALIPGLLIALLVVVLVAAVAKQARADDDRSPRRLGVITDARIPESSGLAVSSRVRGVAYTVNDSGSAARVFSVSIATGAVVGVTKLVGTATVDTEALGVDPVGRLWVADIGDNDGVRDTVALYALPQPGRGDHAVRPTRYRLRYSDGPQDAETLLVNPSTGEMQIVTKGLLRGVVYELPRTLHRGRVNVVSPLSGASGPVLATDGSVLPDGRHVLVRNYLGAYAYDARTWRPTWTTTLPRERQGESLSVEPNGRSFLVNTEGLPSAIWRVELPSRLQTTHLHAAGGIIDAG